jgi:hypothetical protein
MYYDWWSVCVSVLVSGTRLRPITRFLLLSDIWTFVDVGHLLWWQDRSVAYSCCRVSPMQLFLGVSTTGLMTIFYYLKFETPPSWMSRPWYLYPQEQGGPVTPPPPGTEISPSSSLSARLRVKLYSIGADPTENTFLSAAVLHSCSHWGRLHRKCRFQ